jgi:hypothetical protein
MGQWLKRVLFVSHVKYRNVAHICLARLIPQLKCNFRYFIIDNIFINTAVSPIPVCSMGLLLSINKV